MKMRRWWWLKRGGKRRNGIKNWTNEKGGWGREKSGGGEPDFPVRWGLSFFTASTEFKRPVASAPRPSLHAPIQPHTRTFQSAACSRACFFPPNEPHGVYPQRVGSVFFLFFFKLVSHPHRLGHEVDYGASASVAAVQRWFGVGRRLVVEELAVVGQNDQPHLVGFACLVNPRAQCAQTEAAR